MRPDALDAAAAAAQWLVLAAVLGLLWILCPSFSPNVCGRMAATSVVALALYRVILTMRLALIRKSRKRLPEHPDTGFFARFGALLTEELVRFVLLTVLFWASGPGSAITAACVAASVFAVEKQTFLHWLFSRINYHANYRKFARDYDIFARKTRGLTAPVAVPPISRDQPAVVTPNSPVYAALLSSGCGASEGSGSIESLLKLLNVSEYAGYASLPLLKPQYALNFFRDSQTALTQPMAIDCPIPRHSTRPDVIERLYTVSPKNTLHLQYLDFTLPAKLRLSDDPTLHAFAAFTGTREALSVRSEASEMSTMLTAELCDFASSETLQFSETPEFSDKREFSGDSSASDPEVLRGSRTSKKLSAERFAVPMSWDYKWHCWLFCTHQHHRQQQPSKRTLNASIHKKFSSYTLHNESLPLRVCDSTDLYGSSDKAVDWEKGLASSPLQNSQLVYLFNLFANRYLDTWVCDCTSLCAMDPAFVRFGVPLLEMPRRCFAAYQLSAVLWQALACLALVQPFNGALQAAAASFISVTLVAKLFARNYLHTQCTRMYKFSILVELLVNSSLFASIYTYCIMGR